MRRTNRRRKVACVLLFFIWLITLCGNSGASTQANLTILESVPTCIRGVTTEKAVGGPAELPPAAAITAEMRHLETTLPLLATMEIPIYIVRKRCLLPGFGWLAGCTIPGEKAVYLFASPQYKSYTYRVKNGTTQLEPFAPYLAAYTVAHEIGHILRYELISEQTLKRYLALRGVTQTEPTDWGNNAEEIFAEDFRWLFGSETARQVPYLCYLQPPGEKEKTFFLKLLGEAALLKD